MKLDHVAFNVTDAVALADWYVAHLDMKIIRNQDIKGQIVMTV